MLLNSWSLALLLISLLVVFLLAVAGRSAVAVIRFWNPASDDSRQLGLESQVWLASTLVSYALALQILSLILLVLAADSFAAVITGAMCATGTLLANPFGMPALAVKLAGVFLYGFWLVLHRLDISSEHYPLVRAKCWYLLALLPWLALDIGLQTLYLFNLDPDIIVSCCAVVFTPGSSDSQLLVDLAGETPLPFFYGGVGALLGLGCWLWWRINLGSGFAGVGEQPAGAALADGGGRRLPTSAGVWLYGLLWLLFVPLALLTVTASFSSYIYAMPFHNCPFCILRPEYYYFGFAIYLPLLLAAFAGINLPLLGLFAGYPGLAPAVAARRRTALRNSLLLLLLFTLFASYHFLRYLVGGGQW